jgi:hypothetical protein
VTSYRTTRAFERRPLPEPTPRPRGEVAEDRLPCDVLVAPATIFRKDANLSTLLFAIRSRIGRDIAPLDFNRLGAVADRDVTIARLSAALAEAREALAGTVAEWDKMTRYGSPLAKDANENLSLARAILAKIAAAEGNK